MPPPTAPVAVFVEGRIIYSIYDQAKHRHLIECDLCGTIVSGDLSGHATRLFDHRGRKECIDRRKMILANPELVPDLHKRLSEASPSPAHVANRCPGAPSTWEHGTMWDSYAFHKHKDGNLGWIPAGFEGDTVYIRADNCEGKPQPSGFACKACHVVVSSKRFREITTMSTSPLDPRTRPEHRSYAQLLEAYYAIRDDKRRLRSRVQALQRSLRVARRKLEDHERLLMALSQRNVPRLRNLLATALRRGASPKRLFSLVLRAADGLYKARADAEDQYELDIAYLVAALGGPRLLYALSRSHGLLSHSSVKKHHHYAQLLASVGMPTETEIVRNMDAFLDPSVWPLPDDAPNVDARDLAGHTIMVDDVALEERPQYDQTRDHIVGLSRESVLATGVSTQASSAEHIDHLAALLESKELRLAKQATAVVIAPVAEPVHYSPVPLVLSGSDKSEKGPALRGWLADVIACYNDHTNGAKRRGPVWTLASDGDATFRWARHHLCCTHPLPANSPLRQKLAQLPGLNLHTSSDGKTTATCDPKHVIKRFATLLRCQTGVMLGDTNIRPADILTSLKDVGGCTHEEAVQLLDPSDKQNVPKATSLMTTLKDLRRATIPPSISRSPALLKHHLRVVSFAEVLNFFTQPFIDVEMSLSDQLESLSAYAHSAVILFQHHRFESLTSALYADSQATVKNIFFMVARLQLLGRGKSLYLLHEGSDRLENVFGDLRTINHARSFDLLEAARKLTTAFHIHSIFRRNPQLDRGHRRLDLSAVAGVDHLNPRSWKGDVSVDRVDLKQVWDNGRKRALSLLQPVLGPARIDLSHCTRDGYDFLRPEGHWVGVSEDLTVLISPDDQRSDRVEPSITEHIEPAARRPVEVAQAAAPGDGIARSLSATEDVEGNVASVTHDDWNLDNLLDEEEDASLEFVTSEVSDESPLSDGTHSPAEPASPPPHTGVTSSGPGASTATSAPDRSRVFVVNGKEFWKASYIRARLSARDGKKVNHRILRVRGTTERDVVGNSRFSVMNTAPDSNAVRRGDLAGCIMHTGSYYNYVVLEISGFGGANKPLLTSMTADEFAKHCDTRKSTVVGQILELVPLSSSQWHWTGRYPALPSSSRRSAAHPTRSQYTVEVPAALVHVLRPEMAFAQDSAEEHKATWAFNNGDLKYALKEAWKALEPDSEDIVSNVSVLLQIRETASLPYRNNGRPAFVVDPVPALLQQITTADGVDDAPANPVQTTPATQNLGEGPSDTPSLTTANPSSSTVTNQAQHKYECKLCTHTCTLPQMRHHVGMHLIRAARSAPDKQLSKVTQDSIDPGACGWCGRLGTCSTSIVFKAKGTPVISSTCEYHYTRLGYTSALKTTKNGPCTNVPLHCPICPLSPTGAPRTVWKYGGADHFNKEHGRQPGVDPVLKTAFFFTCHTSLVEEAALGVKKDLTIAHRKTNNLPGSDDLPHAMQQPGMSTSNVAVRTPSQSRRPTIAKLTPLDAVFADDSDTETPVATQDVSPSIGAPRARSATTESEKEMLARPVEKRPKTGHD